MPLPKKYTLEEVAKQLAPDDVFSEEQLIAWAKQKHAGNIFTRKELREGIEDQKEESHVFDH